MSPLPCSQQLSVRHRVCRRLLLLSALPIGVFTPWISVEADRQERPASLPDITGYAQGVAKQEMEQLISRLRTRGIKVEAAVELGNAAQEVCDYAREHDVDLIITSTHGSTGLKHVLIGSIAEHIVRYAYCPVLAVSNQKRGRVSP